MLERSGVSAELVRDIEASAAFGALTTALRRAEAYGLAVAAALPGLAERAEVGAVDLASVLHERVYRWTRASLEAGRGRQPRLVCGLIPATSHTATGEMADALTARARLIEERTHELI